MIHYPALRLYCYYGFPFTSFTIPGEIDDLGTVKVFQHFGKSAVRASVPVFLLHSATIFIYLFGMYVCYKFIIYKFPFICNIKLLQYCKTFFLYFFNYAVAVFCCLFNVLSLNCSNICSISILCFSHASLLLSYFFYARHTLFLFVQRFHTVLFFL